MTPIEEAIYLSQHIQSALQAMDRFQKPKFRESEVDFRFETVVGFLIIAQNDVVRMIDEWEEDTKQAIEKAKE